MTDTPALRPWLPHEVRWGMYRHKGRQTYERAGVLLLTQVCDEGVALGPSQQMTTFDELLREWEWLGEMGAWHSCGEKP